MCLCCGEPRGRACGRVVLFLSLKLMQISLLPALKLIHCVIPPQAIKHLKES